MNTTPVNSPANLFQPTTPNAGKQDTGSASDTGSFNQMLSREMSGNTASDSAKANAGNSTNNLNNNNGNANNNVNSANDASKPVQKDAGNGDASGKNDTKTEAKDTTTANAGKTDDDKVASGKDVKKDDKETNAVTADPSAIAAFVAALTSAKAAAPAETAVATAAPDTKVVLTDSEIKTRNDAINVATSLANSDKAAESKDAIGKQSDFVSALDKAAASADDSAKAAATAIKADADIAAAGGKTIKVMDAAIGSTPQTITAIAAAVAIQPRNDMQTNSSALLPTVGSQDWNQALGQKVVWMAKGAEQTATLTLNPPDLGPMQVTVNVSNNQATATFVAHQPEVRHALEASLPKLREMLNEAGIQLGQSSVSGGTQSQQGSFDEARQGSSGRRAQSDDAIESAVHVSHVPTPAGGTGMVDTFA
jgi:flagellar hook-length control protein FliK